MPEVLIDGVRYVPVTESNPNAEAIMRALALTYETPESLPESGDSAYRHLRVTVAEAGYGADPSNPTIEQFVAQLLDSLRKEAGCG